MGFLRKLFGGEKKSGEYVDTQGVYFFVRCDNCGTITRLRADKQHDLLNQGDGFVWHKTIVDNRCFRPMPTVVTLDDKHQVINSEITGGEYVSEDDYKAWLESKSKAADVGDATEGDEEGE